MPNKKLLFLFSIRKILQEYLLFSNIFWGFGLDAFDAFLLVAKPLSDGFRSTLLFERQPNLTAIIPGGILHHFHGESAQSVRKSEITPKHSLITLSNMPWIEGFKLKTRWISFKKQKWCPTMQAPQPHATGALWKHLPFLSTRNVLSVKLKGSFQDPNFTIPSPPTVPPTDSCITTQRIAVSQAGLRRFYITSECSLHYRLRGYAKVQILDLPGTRHLPAFQVHQPARKE